MINKNFILYLFLLTAPFLSIVSFRINSKAVFIFVALFLIFNFFFYKIRLPKESLKELFFIIFFLISILFISEIHSLIFTNNSNLKSIRFFGLFLPIFTYYLLMYDLSYFLKKYLTKILTFYILVFSISIFVDYFILHSMIDITLQPMYDKNSLTYITRPFGLTGQPSVNSVLLVFFYTVLLSIKSKNNSKILFIFVTVGVALQGSGSGFISYLMLLFCMLKNVNYIYKYLLYLIGLFIFLLLLDNGFLYKISGTYILEMVNVVFDRTQNYYL